MSVRRCVAKVAMCYCIVFSSFYAVVMGQMFYVQGASATVYCSSSICLMLRTHISSCIDLHMSTAVCVFTLHVCSIASQLLK